MLENDLHDAESNGKVQRCRVQRISLVVAFHHHRRRILAPPTASPRHHVPVGRRRSVSSLSEPAPAPNQHMARALSLHFFQPNIQATRQHANATRRQSTRFTDYRPRRRIGSPSETVDQPRAGRKPPSWNRRDKRRGIAHQHNPPRDMRANRIICTLSAFCRQNPMAQTVTHLKLSNNNRKARGKACAMGYELSRRGKQ